MECLCYCISDQIDLSKLEKQLKQQELFSWERSRNTMQVIHKHKDQIFYVFKNGTLITWNIKRYEVKKIVKIVKPAAIKPLEYPVKDQFSYQMGMETKLWPHNYFNIDCIQLESEDHDLKLALSYGLSTSIKLNFYENNLERQINKYLPVIEKHTAEGIFTFSRKQIGKILGEIITTKSQINLSSEILYQPKFFWKHPNLEKYYDMMEKYLDIPVRVETINQQLATLNEIFEMFNLYLMNKHSHNLEIIIIVLIGVEIALSVLSLLNFHL